jgi:hypothetical protein
MKNLLKISCILITIGLIATSCKNTAMMKRHYNKGFYISHTSKKENADQGKHEKDLKAGVVVSEPKHEANAEPFVVSKTEPKEQNVASSSETVTKEKASKRHSKAASQDDELAYGFDRPSKKELIKNPFKLLDLAGARSDDDGLSLVWVIIVIILVIYLLGLIFDNFGIGNIIHLLALIALVLLILWLLRVI